MKILLLLPDDLLRLKISQKSIAGVSQGRFYDIGGSICVACDIVMDWKLGLVLDVSVTLRLIAKHGVRLASNKDGNMPSSNSTYA
jgi:hypothetical protein